MNGWTPPAETDSETIRERAEMLTEEERAEIERAEKKMESQAIIAQKFGYFPESYWHAKNDLRAVKARIAERIRYIIATSGSGGPV